MKQKLRRLLLGLSALVLVLGGVLGIATPSLATTSTLTCGVYGSIPSFNCVSFSGFSGQRPWGYPVDANGHNCTNYVTYRLWQNGVTNPGNLGNAYQWDDNATAYGIPVNNMAAVGSVAVWEINSPPATSTGHVAYVDSVNTDGSLNVSEDNFNGTSMTRHLYPGSNWPNHFIHFKDMSGSTPQRRTINTDFNRDTKPDLYTFQRVDPGSGHMAVRIINGQNFNQWLLQDATILGPTGSETSFAVEDYNGDGYPDIWAIQRNDSSGYTAVRIINGLNRQQWLLQTQTILPQTGAETSFAVGDYNGDGKPDLWAIQGNDAGSNSTAVRIIDGNGFNSWLLQTGTVLGQTGAETSFGLGDYNGDGKLDLYAIQRNDSSGTTAVRIVNGNGFNSWLLQTGTVLGQTDQMWDFKVGDYNGDGYPDIWAIQRNDAGSNSTAIRVINGNGFNSWLIQSGTLLGQTDSSWQFN